MTCFATFLIAFRDYYDLKQHPENNSCYDSGYGKFLQATWSHVVELKSLRLLHYNYLFFFIDFVWKSTKKDEKLEEKVVRFRSIGDVTCTGACESKADNIDDIIAEVASATTTERGTRGDDKKSETSMEDRKQQGYF